MTTIFSEQTLIVAILILAIAVFMNVLLSVYTSRLQRFKDDRLFYNTDSRSAQYDDMREYFEYRIKELELRLLSDRERWQEIYQLQLSGQSSVKGDFDENISLRNGIPTEFFTNMNIHFDKVQIDKRLVFVLTPYSKDEAQTYEVIKKVCDRVDLRCVRGDEEFMDRRDILSHILSNLVRARIVIANINGRNANVLYELGIAHAISKPTILVGESLSDAPFDLQSRRIVLYSSLDELEVGLREELLRTTVGQKS